MFRTILQSLVFAFVTRRPYCPGRPKKLCFTTLSLARAVLTGRLCVVNQSFFGLPGQYGRRVTKANGAAMLEELYSPPTWQPVNSVNIWNLLWLS